MATWKKVVVSGSSAELAALKVDNLTSGQVVIGGGNSANLSTTAINGSGNIVATTGATGLSASGSFSGSFQGAFTGTAATASFVTASNVFGPYGSNSVISASHAVNAGTANQVANSLTQGTGVTAFTYNGSSAQTVAVSGASTLSTNAITKWTGAAFANSSLTDNGTTITGATSLQLTGASSILTGSFSGSFTGNINASITTAQTASVVAVTHTATGATYYPTFVTAAGNGQTLFADTASAAFTFNSDTSTLTVTASFASTASFVTSSRVFGPFGANSVLSASYAVSASYVTGSIFTSTNPALSASYALSASFTNTAGATVASLTAGNGLTGTTFNGSAASTFAVGAGAIITVDADAVMVTTSSLTTNQIPKYSANALAGSNITDTGTQVQIAGTATSGLSVAAGGVTVTGNSTFNNNVNIVGDLTVAGTASFQNTQNLLIGDRFIALASGSTTLTDGGIIVVSSTTANGMSGSAWYLEAGNGTDHGTYGRWATSFNVHASSSAATVSEYAVTVNVAASSNPSAAPVWGGANNGSGNMWINNTSGDIFIYA